MTTVTDTYDPNNDGRMPQFLFDELERATLAPNPPAGLCVMRADTSHLPPTPEEATKAVREFNNPDRLFPEDDAERQTYPIGTFCTEFFPHALAELAHFSHKQQQKHNPDGPIGWARDKSIWSINRIFRHAMQGWMCWIKGDREGAKEEFCSLAWRALEGLERMETKMEPFNKE